MPLIDPIMFDSLGIPTGGTGNPNAFDLRGGHDYTGYRQATDFDYDPGVFVLPLASRTPQTVIVRVHGGLGTRVVNVAASKRGSPPILPAAVDTDQDTLIGCSVNIPLPAFNHNSPGFDWAATGTYVYVTTGRGGPRIPGKSMLPAGQYPFPLPMQDAAVEMLAQSGEGVNQVAKGLPQAILAGSVMWPFTVYPPQFFNNIVLRSSDKEYFDADLSTGGPGLGD